MIREFATICKPSAEQAEYLIGLSTGRSFDFLEMLNSGLCGDTFFLCSIGLVVRLVRGQAWSGSREEEVEAGIELYNYRGEKVAQRRKNNENWLEFALGFGVELLDAEFFELSGRPQFVARPNTFSDIKAPVAVDAPIPHVSVY